MIIEAISRAAARIRITAAVLVAAGCVSAPAPDSAASTTCDPTGTFGPLVPVPGLSAADLDESTARLSPDELTAYFTLREPGTTTAVLDADLYVARRSSVTEAFGTASKLTALDTAMEDQDPTVSSDGLTLWYASNYTAMSTTVTPYHVYVSTRTSLLAEFGAPSLAASVNGSDTTKDDGQAFVTADGSELWFTSTRDPNQGGNDIWRAPRAGAAFGAPVLVPELNSTFNDWLPVLSADRLTVYFASNRGGNDNYDIWTAHRTTVNDGFPVPTRVPELSTPGADFPGWLSPDNCRMYESSIDSLGQHLDIYMATRLP